MNGWIAFRLTDNLLRRIEVSIEVSTEKVSIEKVSSDKVPNPVDAIQSSGIPSPYLSDALWPR